MDITHLLPKHLAALIPKPKPVSVVFGGDFDLRPDEQFPWLWKPYLAFGMVSILDGDPGVGKSLITCDLAARLALGRAMPDGSPAAVNPVTGKATCFTIFVNADDNVQQVIVPRLYAAGGLPHFAAFLGGVGERGTGMMRESGVGEMEDCRAFRLPRDVDYLSHFLTAEKGAPGSLVILDPVMAMVSGSAASSDQAVRATFNPLVKLAAETKSCILLVRHLNKTGGRASLYRGGGSIGIVGACRTGLLAGIHPDDPSRRVLSMTKSNIGPLAPSLAYRIEVKPERLATIPVEAGQVNPRTGKKAKKKTEYELRLPEAPAIAWDGPTPITADDLCSAKPDLGAQSARAAEWLQKLLANGPVPATVVEAQAYAEGLGYTTVRAVKVKLNIESQRVIVDGVARWEWMLPRSKEEPTKGVPVSTGLLNNLAKLPPLEPLPPLDQL